MKLREQIKKMLRLMESNKALDLNESGAVRALIAMRWLVPNIKTIGFISAENPNGEPATPAYNRKATKDLRTELSDGQWGYQAMKGKYGTEENSFFVRNIRKDDLLRMGSNYKQESVIFGEKFVDKDYTGMTFQMIYSTPERFGEIAGEMKVYVNRDNAKDFFSKIKGRKFMIPFYGTEDIVSIPNSGEATISTDFSDAKWKGGQTTDKTFSFTPPQQVAENSSIIPDEVLVQLDKLQEDALRTVGSASYNYRGQIKKILKKYER